MRNLPYRNMTINATTTKNWSVVEDCIFFARMYYTHMLYKLRVPAAENELAQMRANIVRSGRDCSRF